MGYLLGPAIAFAIACAMYVYFLRLSSKWTLGYKLSNKLAWIWCSFAIVLALATITIIAPFQGPPFILLVAEVLFHIALGGAFFGNYAVDHSDGKPGFIKGVLLVGAAVAMALAIYVGLIVGSTFLLSRMN